MPLHLDKQTPNEQFTIFIRQEHLSNFGYDVLAWLKGKRIAVKGLIRELGGRPVMYIKSEKEVKLE